MLVCWGCPNRNTRLGAETAEVDFPVLAAAKSEIKVQVSGDSCHPTCRWRLCLYMADGRRKEGKE